jgi:hypothetical protein
LIYVEFNCSADTHKNPTEEEGMNALSRDIATVSTLAFLALATSLQARGAELRPYTLPSQQAEPRIEQRKMEVRPQIDDTYYQDFEQKARALNSDQRAKLVLSFERKRDQAVEAGRVEVAQHYLRLLQILQKDR